MLPDHSRRHIGHSPYPFLRTWFEIDFEPRRDRRPLTVCFRATAVANFDSDTIAIDARTSLRLAAHDEYVLDLLRQDVMFRERQVLSSQGQHLGRIKDVALDSDGIVTEYWIRRNTLGRLE